MKNKKSLGHFTTFIFLLFLFSISAIDASANYYQIKIYHFKTTAQEDRLDNYFKNAFIPAMHKAGISDIGIFKLIDQDTDRRIFVLIPFKNLEDSPPLPDNELAAVLYNNDSSPFIQQRFEVLIKHFDEKKDSLHRTGVTKQLLWVEYVTQYPDGYKYSQYCYLFRKYLRDSDPAFHWEYSPAEFTQIDFAGKKLSYLDKSTGKMIPCQIFVATVPYSGLIFSIAVPSQKTADFAHCINEMVKYIGGVTKSILCDNLKTAVTRADKHGYI